MKQRYLGAYVGAERGCRELNWEGHPKQQGALRDGCGGDLRSRFAGGGGYPAAPRLASGDTAPGTRPRAPGAASDVHLQSRVKKKPTKASPSPCQLIAVLLLCLMAQIM